jgi:hypothetical protein
LVPETQVGAAPPMAAIASPKLPKMPPARRVSGGACAFRFSTPPPVTVRHVAPCGPANGTGAADRPWPTLKKALAALEPGEVAYVHDDPALAVDYRESDLTAARSGTGACAASTSNPAWIRVMGAPGEKRPVVQKPSNATLAKPVLRANRSWWLIEGIAFNGSRVQQHSVVVVSGGCVTLRDIEVTGAGAANASVAFSDARQSALLNSRIWEPLRGDEVTGRPAAMPTSSKDFHGVTVSGASDGVLVANNDSHGHNGDSIQCGEGADTNGPDPQNVTIQGNRYHQDEENAIDLKHCERVTIRANKLFGYHPARPLATKRSPHGDAIVVHANRFDEPAGRILIERNRLFRDSRAINVSAKARTVVIRRNVIFGARNDFCGIGAGIAAGARPLEIYNNTLDRFPAPAQRAAGCNSWSENERAAIRLTNQTTSQRAVLWNNIVAHAYRYLAITLGSTEANRNLFDETPSGGVPPASVIADPMFVADPANNDYFTRRGSRARDAAAPLSQAIRDPTTYCDDPGDPDSVAQPDIGFLESCT